MCDDSNRQGGSEKNLGFKDSYPAALRFGSHEDARNFASQVVKNGRDWLARENWNVAKRYVEGEFDIVLEYSSRTDSAKYHLVLSAIPDRGWNGNAAVRCASKLNSLGEEPAASVPDRNEGGVFTARNLVHGPEGVIPSLIRLERAEQRDDITWQVLAPSAYHVSQFRSVVSERKVAGFGTDLAIEKGAGECGLIQGMPQAFDGILSQVRETVWDVSDEFDLVKLSDAIVVHLDSSGVWFAVSEGFRSRFEIPYVFLSPR